MKLGLWLPHRRSLTPVSTDRPGIFLTPVARAITRALRKRFSVRENLDFRKASVVGRKVLYNGFDLATLDGFLWFSHIRPYSDDHHIQVLDALERAGVKVLNPPHGLRIGLDKFKTSSFLRSKGIPVPDFALIPSDNLEHAGKLVEKWGSVLLKPRFGAFGIGIVKVNDSDTLIDMLDHMGANEYYMERFYENDMNDWCGINVIGNRVIHGYGKKPSKISGWKVLDRGKRGGEMILRKPSTARQHIAEKIAKATELDFFGIDVIRARNGRDYVVDLNTFPGLYPDMLRPARVDIGKEFLRMVAKQVK